MACIHCDVFAGFSSDAGTPTASGTCRRRAPAVMLDGKGRFLSRWPIVGAADWCGEFKNKKLSEVQGGANGSPENV
jgi:hypothetical protein